MTKRVARRLDPTALQRKGNLTILDYDLKCITSSCLQNTLVNCNAKNTTSRMKADGRKLIVSTNSNKKPERQPNLQLDEFFPSIPRAEFHAKQTMHGWLVGCIQTGD